MYRDYNVCEVNEDGIHHPIRATADWEIADTHVAVECGACGITTGYPIEEFADGLEWN